ncbi:MAG: tetratricopeptide repeat protein [Deltaproteobacteria bacterium]|nr:tetratricopeptide repeat protein [Deltaproteobacteria bacterium]
MDDVWRLLSERRCAEAEYETHEARRWLVGPYWVDRCAEPSVHDFNLLGLVDLLCRKNPTLAAKHFQSALAADPTFAPGHNNLGVALMHHDPPKLEEACREFKATLELEPEDPNGLENYGFCQMRRGLTAHDGAERADFFDEAKRPLRLLIRLQPENFRAHHHLGLVALAEQEYDVAEKHFNRCLALDEGNPACCHELGQVFLATERCDMAIEAFVCALHAGEKAEVAAEARTNLGVAYEACAKTDDTISTLLDRLKAAPDVPSHHVELGRSYAAKGMFKRALEEWAYATKLDSTYCPAHYEVAMAANEHLAAPKAVESCNQLITCVGQRKDGAAQWADQAEWCKSLVERLDVTRTSTRGDGSP